MNFLFRKAFHRRTCSPRRFRQFSSGILTCEKLARSLIRIRGPDAAQFLQGLITNDVTHLQQNERGGAAMYAMMLNSQGRVLFDAILYRSDPSSVLLECDSALAENALKHVRTFRLRRNVDISKVEDGVWALFPRLDAVVVDGTKTEDFVGPLASESTFDSGVVARDPRLGALGWRILTKDGRMPNQEICRPHKMEMSDGDLYKALRCKLGVAEGGDELPPGQCFPLESNADYLHGVSFHKGCYLGQELTARTHHTGVVRKRLAPVQILSRDPEESDLLGADILDEEGRKVGKLRSVHQKTGLGIALVRIRESAKAKELTAGKHKIRTFIPFWWPKEVPKENQRQ